MGVLITRYIKSAKDCSILGSSSTDSPSPFKHDEQMYTLWPSALCILWPYRRIITPAQPGWRQEPPEWHSMLRWQDFFPPALRFLLVLLFSLPILSSGSFDPNGAVHVATVSRSSIGKADQCANWLIMTRGSCNWNKTMLPQVKNRK